MKLKRFVLVLLSFSMILCACGAPTESESQSEQETETDSLPSDAETKTETDFPLTDLDTEGEAGRQYYSTGARKPSQSILDALNRIMSPWDLREDPNWDAKIRFDIYNGTIDKNGKFLINIQLSLISEKTANLLVDEISQTNPTERISPERAIILWHEAKLAYFFDSYIADHSDLYARAPVECVLRVYATPEDIVRYAKCMEVISLVPSKVDESQAFPEAEIG